MRVCIHEIIRIINNSDSENHYMTINSDNDDENDKQVT